MTDKQWYDLTKAEYEKVAAGLLADGYSRNERTDIYKEDFTKTGFCYSILEFPA